MGGLGQRPGHARKRTFRGAVGAGCGGTVPPAGPTLFTTSRPRRLTGLTHRGSPRPLTGTPGGPFPPQSLVDLRAPWTISEHLGQERLGSFVLGPGQHLARDPLFDDHALVHEHQPERTKAF